MEVEMMEKRARRARSLEQAAGQRLLGEGSAAGAAPSRLPSGLLVLLCVTSGVERADEAILPASYDAIGTSLGISVAMLGSLTFGRTLLQALCCPFIAPFIDKVPLLQAIGWACLGWGVATALIGGAQSYATMLVLHSLTGLCLSVAIPALRSVTSAVDAASLGRAFGLLQFGGNAGAILGASLATMVGSQVINTPLGSQPGWRFTFVACGAVSVCLGAHLLQRDDSDFGAEQRAKRQLAANANANAAGMWKHYAGLREVLSRKTFLFIIAQGVVGCMPWRAFTYLTLILQQSGFSDAQAASVILCFNLGCTLGVLVGGVLCDELNRRFPGRGYIITAQISVALQLPLGFLCLEVLPFDTEHIWTLCAAFGLFGLCISWCGGANSAMLSEVVPSDLRNAVFAFNYGIQGSLSSAAIPLVALLAAPGKDASRALAHNIFLLTAFASVWMSIIYAALHSPYQRERVLTHRER